MARIDDAIRAAEAEVTQAQALPETTDAEKATKATKVAAAEAKVSVLKDQKAAIETDISDAVRGRLPDAQSSARTEERRTVAQALGIPVEQLTDEKLQEFKDAYSGQQSEVDREKQRADTAEQQVTTLTASEAAAKKTAETARDQLQGSLVRSALTAELIGHGVIHDTSEGGQSYLDVALEQAQRLGGDALKVEVEIGDDGTLSIKGDVEGAKEAAEKAAEKYPVFFGEAVESPTQTPGGRGSGGGSRPAYTPNLAVTGPQQSGR